MHRVRGVANVKLGGVAEIMLVNKPNWILSAYFTVIYQNKRMCLLTGDRVSTVHLITYSHVLAHLLHIVCVLHYMYTILILPIHVS